MDWTRHRRLLLVMAATHVLVLGAALAIEAGDLFDRAVTLPLYRRLAGETVKLAAVCALVCVVAGYPLAWGLRLGADRMRQGPIGAMAPAAIEAGLRVLGWVVVLGEFGLVNLMLRTLRLEAEMPRGFVSRELTLLGSMIQVFLPFTVLGLYQSLKALSPDTLRAVRSLGATKRQVFWQVVLPQTLPSALAASGVVFGLATGAYVTVVIFGGTRVRNLASLAFDESSSLVNWQIGAVIVVAAAAGLYSLVRWLTNQPDPEPANPPTR